MPDQEKEQDQNPLAKMTKILVVDDDADITDIIAKALKSKQYRIVTTNRMEVVLDSGQSMEYFDVAIIDLFMPGIGGIEGIKRIKQQNPECKVIAISGGWSEMSVSDALGAARKIGADRVLAKPFRVSDIRDTVSQVSGESRAVND